MTDNHNDNLVKCKACGKEIAKGVKKCPHCGKDQRNWFMRHKFLSIIGLIIVLAIIGNMLGGGDDTANDTATNTTETQDSNNAADTDTTEPEPAEKVYAVGEVIPIDDTAEYTITKVEEMSKIGDPNMFGKQASEGATLIAMQYTVKNISKEPMGMFDYPTLNLVDETGIEYDSDLDASSAYAVETGIDNSKVLSDLNPGITVTGTEVYEISQESYASGEWFIQIGDQKVKIK